MRNQRQAAPSIRFKGFTEDWEQRKFSSLYEKGGSGGTPKSTNKSYYIGDIPFLGISDVSSSNGYVYDTEKHISEEGLKNSSAWIVPKEAISLAMYASVGKVAILKTDAATSQAFFNMIFKNLPTRNFVFQYLLKMESTHGWDSLVSTGTQPNLNAQKIREIEILIPALDEQTKIGAFFKQLDTTITLQQQQLSNYKEMKAALLQKMFPKAGEKMPEVRFEGFTGEWEERKLGDVIVEYSDKDNSKLNPAVAVGKYGIRRREDIYKKALSKDISKNKVIRKNTLTIGMGSKQIDIGILKTDEVFSVSPAYSTFNIIDVDARYLDLFLQHENKNLSKVCMIISARQGKTVDKNLLVQYNVLLPSIPEQQKIADFLFILDGQIEAQKAAFDALNRLKQGLLQQMFV